MGSTIFAFTFGLLMFAMAGEADTPLLRFLGTAAAVWMIVAGSIAGWQWARRD